MSNGYKQKLGDFREVRHSYSSKATGALLTRPGWKYRELMEGF